MYKKLVLQYGTKPKPSRRHSIRTKTVETLYAPALHRP
jgi:hypothetical protein